MIKAIIKWFKNLREEEIDHTIEIEFSVYDIIFVVVVLMAVWYCFFKH